MSLAWESASPVPCLFLWERWPSAARTERANKEGPPPGGPSQRVDKPILSFRGAPQGYLLRARSDVGIRNLLVANSQKSVKIVRFWNRLPRQSADWLAMTDFFDSLCQREALTEGLSLPGGAEPRPYTRLPIAFAPSVRADVGIRPYEITGGVCVIRTGGRLCPPLQPPIDSKNTFQTSGQRPPPTFAALRQRRDLIIAHPPGGCFQRGRAAALPLWSFQGEKIFKKRGKSKSPFS